MFNTVNANELAMLYRSASGGLNARLVFLSTLVIRVCRVASVFPLSYRQLVPSGGEGSL